MVVVVVVVGTVWEVPSVVLLLRIFWLHLHAKYAHTYSEGAFEAPSGGCGKRCQLSISAQRTSEWAAGHGVLCSCLERTAFAHPRTTRALIANHTGRSARTGYLSMLCPSNMHT